MDIEHKIVVESKYNNVEILPLVDLHLGSFECDEKLIDSSISYIKNHKNCYTFLGGDIIECNVYGKANNVHSQKLQLDEQVERIKEKLYPIRNKILFSITGNHEHRVEKSTGLNLSKIIADSLNVKFCDWESHFLIKFKGNKICRLYAHHGTGASVTSGAKLNSAEKLHFRSPMANIIICGHLHFPINSEKEIRYLDNNGKLKTFTQHYVVCGSTHGSNGYASMKAYPPVPCSMTKITIVPHASDFSIFINKLKE